MTRIITCDRLGCSNTGSVEFNTRMTNFDLCYDCSTDLKIILTEWLGKRLHSWERITDGSY